MESTGKPQRADPSSPGIDGLTARRVQLLLGLTTLSFVALHVLRQGSALAGPEAWLETAGGPNSQIRQLLWTFPFLAYGAFGLWLSRRLRPDPLGTPRLVTGALSLAFLLFHVAHTWPPVLGPHASPRAGYAAMWDSVGLPWVMAIYVVGLSATSLHLALGVEWSAAALAGIAPAAGLRRGLRYLAGVIGFAAWGATLHLLGHYAIGDGLIPFGETLDSVAPRTGEPIELVP